MNEPLGRREFLTAAGAAGVALALAGCGAGESATIDVNGLIAAAKRTAERRATGGPPSLSGLQRAMKGHVFTRGTPGFKPASLVYNERFDNQVPRHWRDDFWHRIAQTPHLDWLLLTKRPGNIAKMLPDPETGVKPWGGGWPNVWLGVSAGNQEDANRNIPLLLATPARVHMVSLEPLLGPIDLTAIACPNGCQPPEYCSRCHPDGGEPTGTYDVLGAGLVDAGIVDRSAMSVPRPSLRRALDAAAVRQRRSGRAGAGTQGRVGARSRARDCAQPTRCCGCDCLTENGGRG